MRRTGNLYEQILDRENLRLAFSRALRGKRSRSDARAFAADLETNLRNLGGRLRAQTFEFGRHHQFVIRDPKERIITAPCFAERVVHHAVMNVSEPVFERWLIDDTYACRRGRGRNKALLRAQRFAARFPAFLKLDIRKYFDSIAHEVLLGRLSRLFKDRALLSLFDQIVRSFRGATGRGLPIGSLTSQHFANFYLGWFDRFVKEQLWIKGYVRYMDDMALWAESPLSLQNALHHIGEFLDAELQLELKPHPYSNRTRHGMQFLGCRVFDTHLTLNRRSRRRFRRKLQALERQFLQGTISELELQQRASTVVAFARTARVSSWRFRRQVLQQLAVGGQ